MALAELFAAVADRLAAYQDQIAEELALVQGEPVDLGGYYRPDPSCVEAVMRQARTVDIAMYSFTDRELAEGARGGVLPRPQSD